MSFISVSISEALKKEGNASNTEQDESEKAKKVAHILRSRESEHNIRKVHSQTHKFFLII